MHSFFRNAYSHILTQSLNLLFAAIKVLRVLRRHELCPFLSAIPVAISRPISGDRVFDDVTKERCVTLNGISFFGKRNVDSGQIENTAFLTAFPEFCRHFCKRERLEVHHQEVMNIVLSKMARTVTATDSYFTANSIFRSPDLVLMPRPDIQPPIDVELYVCEKQLHCRVASTSIYGLYKKKAIEKSGRMDAISRRRILLSPFIKVDTALTDKSYFDKDSLKVTIALRLLKVSFPVDKSK